MGKRNLSTIEAPERPHNEDAERAVIGAALIDGAAIARPITSQLTRSDFYGTTYGLIWQALLELCETGKPFDLVVLTDHLNRKGILVEVGGAAKLTELIGATPTALNVEHYAAIVQRCAGRRQLMAFHEKQLVDLGKTTYAEVDPDILRDWTIEQLQGLRGLGGGNGSANAAPVRWTQAELYEADFPDPEWLIPDVLPVGLTWLAGRPKIGKSFMALQIACAVGTGGKFLDRDAKLGKVLFIAYEDPGRRLRKRGKTMGIPSDAQITYDTNWPTFQDGGLQKLQAAIEGDGYDLVTIDTFSRAAGMANQRDQAEMATMVGGLQNLVNRMSVTVQVLDHHRKQSAFAPDPIDDVMEATAKAAVPDTIWGLYTERGKQGATLKIVGRDVEELDLAIRWDALTYSWQLVGEAGEVQEESMKGQILGVIEDLALLGELPTTTRIAEHMKKNVGYVSHTLADMLNEGLIVKGTRQGREQPYNIPHKDNNSSEHSKDSKDSKHPDDSSLRLL